MKALSPPEHTEFPQYNYLFFRIVMAVLGAHIIVSFNVPWTFPELLLMYGYHEAMALSTIIAFSIIETVYRFSAWLDKHYSWVKSFSKRLWRQILGGFIFPLILAVAEGTLYFRAYNIHIKETVYFDEYFPIIALMIGILNVIFIAISLFMQNTAALKWEREEVKRREEADLLEMDGQMILPDAVLFFCRDKNYFYIAPDGVELVWEFTNEETYALLSKSDYFFVSRSFIVLRDNIEKVKPASSHRREIVLKVPAGTSIDVSQRRTPEFLLWWEGKFL